jgi:hypothetical protein
VEAPRGDSFVASPLDKPLSGGEDWPGRQR